MFGSGEGSSSRREFQKGLDQEDTRRRRQDDRLTLRKKTRQQHMNKRRKELRGESTKGGYGGTSGGPDGQVPPHVRLENLPDFGRQMNSEDLDTVFRGVQAVRQLLSVEKSPPIQPIFEMQIVHKLLHIMRENVAVRDPDNKTEIEEKRCKLQFEAAWAITNVASGEREYCFQLCRAGGIEAFMALLQNTKDVETADQCIWGLGNIAGDCAELRDMVLRTGVLDYILKNLFNFPVSMQRNAVWTVSNFCRAKPPPTWDVVSKALQPLVKLLLQTKDYDVIVDILWAISFLSEDRAEDSQESAPFQVDAVIETGVIKYVIHLIQHANEMGIEAWNVVMRERAEAERVRRPERVPQSVLQQLNTSDYVIAPCVRIMGNVVSGTDKQTDVVVEAGFFDVIEICINHRVKNIRKESCWALSNVVAGTQQQLEGFFNRDSLVTKIVKLSQEGDVNVRKEASWCLSNALCGATFEQISILVREGFIRSMVGMLHLHNVEKILLMAMEALDGCFHAYNKHFGHVENYYNEWCQSMEEQNGLEELEQIQQLENVSDKCADMAGELIRKYWGEDDDTAHQPDDTFFPQGEDQFGFGFGGRHEAAEDPFQF